MANHVLSGNSSHNSNRRVSIVDIPIDDHITQQNYNYEYARLMEGERQYMAAQRRLSRENMLINPQLSEYVPPTDSSYQHVQHSQAVPQIERRLSHSGSAIMLARPAPVKPLRIIIIRHAERADAALGSDWSRKSFDRNGRYVRFSEHLPEALPSRSYLHHYVIDVPLTNRGRMHAFKTGKSLLANGYSADICYTSPSLRCVQSAHGILNGMGKKMVPMRMEPGLFECYLNDFKRTLCFMTKDELIANGYNIDRSYKVLFPFMRPHDSQHDYYERCRSLMDIITERHQTTGGTILLVAHAPSLEGLTRHLSGGKFQPEKLFDIARRVPFLAMTIIEKHGPDSPWLFRTQPLQTDQAESTSDALQLSGATEMNHNSIGTHQIQRHHYQHQQPLPQTVVPSLPPPPPPPPLPPPPPPPQLQQHQKSSRIQSNLPYVQQQLYNVSQVESRTTRGSSGPIPIDPKKVVKSSTAPNLRVSHSLSEVFRVI